MGKKRKCVVAVLGGGTGIFAGFGVEVVVLEAWPAVTIWGLVGLFGAATLVAWLAPDRWFDRPKQKRRERALSGLHSRIEAITNAARTQPAATVPLIEALRADLVEAGVPCPPLPRQAFPGDLDDWLWFLVELSPMAESGRVELADTLWSSLKREARGG